MNEHFISISPDGSLSFVYSDALIGLLQAGNGQVTRASIVDPSPEGGWTSDLSLSGGPLLGPFHAHDAAIAAEINWLNRRLFDAGGFGGGRR